ncbi:MAG: H4MPT-linked C1 transfer pathway protein [Candidatus Bathyarchaeota archaeon]|nr:H4MPT-linked C1 transfer pathway protein [Candidatus Bathyarchaeota archaeon]
MVYALGFDVGGANTKAALIRSEGDKVLEVKVASEYFPIWKNPQKLPSVLLTLKEQLGTSRIDVLGLTMTAELSDAYQTKREGVHHILSCVKTAFPHTVINVLNTDAAFSSVEEAEAKPLRVAAANWAATGWVVAQHLKDAVVIDVGSTSTSIIPIAHGKVAAQGKTDLDKLFCGELVYTGSLRTNVAVIVQAIPLRGGFAGVSSELFAQSGDVHRVLGHIDEMSYTSETADGRGKSVGEAMARLARVVCADTEMLTESEIKEMARYIYQQQLKQITEGLSRVYKFTKTLTPNEVPIVVTGLGKDFLARKAAQNAGADAIIDLESLLPKQAVLATPAVGVALMALTKYTGEPIRWT